jgi:hypothetical protein
LAQINLKITSRLRNEHSGSLERGEAVIGIDTNVLVRHIAKDHPSQTK